MPGHDVRARHVGVVGPGEGGAEGELAVGGVVPVVRGAWEVVMGQQIFFLATRKKRNDAFRRTGIVDENVNGAAAVPDSLDGLFDGLVRFHINQQHLDGVGSGRTVRLQLGNGFIAAGKRSGAEEDVVRVGRLEKGLGRFIADATGCTGDDNSLGPSHCRCIVYMCCRRGFQCIKVLNMVN